MRNMYIMYNNNTLYLQNGNVLFVAHNTGAHKNILFTYHKNVHLCQTAPNVTSARNHVFPQMQLFPISITRLPPHGSKYIYLNIQAVMSKV